MRTAVLSVVLVTIVALGGCAGLLGGDSPSGRLSRHVEFVLDEFVMQQVEQAASPSEATAIVAKTSFTYTHAGAAVDPAGLEVVYTDESGAVREEPLSLHTASASVSDGEQVRIEGVAFHSALRIVDDGQTLASRGGSDAPWFRAEGAPLPLAMGPDSHVTWDIVQAGSAEFSMDRLRWQDEDTYTDYDCTSEGCTQVQVTETSDVLLRDAAVMAQQDILGTLHLGTDDGTPIRLDVQGDLSGSVVAAGEVDVLATESGGHEPEDIDAPFGFDMDVTGDGEFLARLFFGSLGLERVGTSASYDAEGSLLTWDHTRDRNDPEQWFEPRRNQESTPYEEDDVEPGEPMSAQELAFIESLYAMDLQAGDAFDLRVEFGDEAFSVSSSASVQVSEEAQRLVGGQEVDALRVQATATIRIDGDGIQQQRISGQTISQWIMKDTYLPVEADTSWSQVLEEEQIDALAQLLQDLSQETGATLELWDVLEASTGTSSKMTMTSIEGDVRVPAAFTVTGLLSAGSTLPLMGLANLGMMGLGDLGEAGATAPQISFQRSEADDTLTIVAADSGADWYDIRMNSGDCELFLDTGDGLEPTYGYGAYMPTPVRAGDRLTVVGSGTCILELVHEPTNTLLGMWTFTM